MNNNIKNIINIAVQDTINLILLNETVKLINPVIPLNKICIYSGRFQPFHINHYNVYKNLCKLFGQLNVYIATAHYIKLNKSPFSFLLKKKTMIKMFNIPENKIYQIKKPYQPVLILSKYNKNNTVYFAALGEKDLNRLSGGKYFISPSNYKIHQLFFYPFAKNGYIYEVEMQTPEYKGQIISGSLIRLIFSNDEYSLLNKKAIFLALYKKYDLLIFNLFINVFSGSIVKTLSIIKLNRSIMFLGGSFGHINHLYEDEGLTFGLLKEIIKSTLYGLRNNKITNLTIKEDGRQMSISYRHDRMVAALGKDHIRNTGAKSLIRASFEQYVNAKPWSVLTKKAYILTFDIINKQFLNSNSTYLNRIFNNGERWASILFIYNKSPMLIPNNKNMIQFHGFFKYDNDTLGIVLFDNSTMYDFMNNIFGNANTLIRQNLLLFEIKIPLPIIWPIPTENLQNLQAHLIKIQLFMTKYKLTDDSTISKYFYNRWVEYLKTRLEPFINTKEQKQLIIKILLIRYLKLDSELKNTILHIEKKYGKLIRQVVSLIDSLKEKIKSDFKYLLLIIISRIELLILRLMWAKFELSTSKLADQMRRLARASILQLKKSTNQTDMRMLLKLVRKIKLMSGGSTDELMLKNIIPIEGIVFQYNNKLYKYTGYFAPINQLFKAIRFNLLLLNNALGITTPTNNLNDININMELHRPVNITQDVILQYEFILDSKLPILKLIALMLARVRSGKINSNTPKSDTLYKEILIDIKNAKTNKLLYLAMIQYDSKVEKLRKLLEKNKKDKKPKQTIDKLISRLHIKSMSTFLHNGRLYPLQNLYDLVEVLYDKKYTLQSKKLFIKHVILDRIDKRITHVHNMLISVKKSTSIKELYNIFNKYLLNIMIYNGRSVLSLKNKQKLEISHELKEFKDTLSLWRDHIFSDKFSIQEKKKHVLELILYYFPSSLDDPLKKKLIYLLNKTTSNNTLFNIILKIHTIHTTALTHTQSFISSSFINKYMKYVSLLFKSKLFELIKLNIIIYLLEILLKQILSPKSTYMRKLLNSIDLKPDSSLIMRYLFNIILASYQLGVYQPVLEDQIPLFAELREKAKRDHHTALKIKLLDYKWTDNEIKKISNGLLSKIKYIEGK